MWQQISLLVTLLIGLSSKVRSDFISLKSIPSPPSGQDITNKVFKTGQNIDILPAAYGDFNGDKLTDIVTIDNNRTTVTIYLASKEVPYMKLGPSWNFTEHQEHDSKFEKINSVTMGDFTGDGLIDLMITTSARVNITQNFSISCHNLSHIEDNPVDTNATLHFTYKVPAIELIFCIGNGKSINCSNHEKSKPLVQEPLIVDLNRDMILDLVGEIWGMENNNTKTNYTIDNKTYMCAPNPMLVKVKAVWLSEEGRPAAKYKEGIFDGKRSTDHLNFPMSHPSSNAYVDIDGDFIPELILITNQSQTESHANFSREIYSVIYDSSSSNLSLHVKSPRKPILLKNETVEILGQPLFIDLERNSNLVHIIPFCAKKDCSTKWGILVDDKSGEFHKIELGPINFGGNEWRIIEPIHFQDTINPQIEINFINQPASQPGQQDQLMNMTVNGNFESQTQNFYSRSIVMQAGDYNLDGYPDLLVVLESKLKAEILKKAVIFENVPCNTEGFNLGCPFTRTFEPNFKFLQEYENVTFASFFDLKENGILDVLIVQESVDQKHPDVKNPNYIVRAFETSSNADSYFIKALVLSGRPCSQCLEKDVPYGNLIPGALVGYTMKDVEGQTQTSIATQGYRSGYTTLDVPYTIFGIGHSPNFVDHFHFYLGYCFSLTSNQSFSHDSRQIIPNSQIYAIPSYPILQDSHETTMTWRVKLFLTPGDAVLQTFGVLIGIIALVAALASGLEYKEKRSDRKERMAEARRFLM